MEKFKQKNILNLISVESLLNLDITLYEEDSYHFLQYYQFAKDWHVYDSDILGLYTATFMTNNFFAFHGVVPFLEKTDITDTFWSSLPLGIFRFKLLQDQSCGLVMEQDKTPGYVVSGAYWDNGFAYAVFNKSDIIQVKLFIDDYTKKTRHYPDMH
jgi:hypothetical protein